MKTPPAIATRLGTPLPPGLPETLLEPVADPIGDLVRRYARTHGPFASSDLSARLGLGSAVVDAALVRLRATGRVTDGEFRPGGRGREWCDAEVLRNVRQRSLAKLRQQVEPVDASALGRFLVTWHGLARPRTGLDGLLDVIEQLQGVPIVASLLEREVLPARIALLHARHARHAARRRRGDVDRRRAAGRARRPHRALPDRSRVAACVRRTRWRRPATRA